MKKYAVYVSVIAALCCYAQPATAFTLSDNFNDNSIDTSWWTDQSSSPSMVAEQNGRLELIQGSSGLSKLVFNHKITGDFEATADFTLLNWPTNSNQRFGFVTDVFGSVQRTCLPPEMYLVHFLPTYLAAAGTKDVSGSLKMERIGSTVYGYYRSGDTWSLIGSRTSSSYADDATFSLRLWPYGTPAEGARASFDNFYLNAPDMANPVPEPSTLVFVGLSMAGAGFIRRKNAR